MIYYAHEDDVLDIYYREKRERERRKFKLSLVQKVIGLLCIILSIADAVLLQDLTLGVIFIPTGLYLLFTREVVF